MGRALWILCFILVFKINFAQVKPNILVFVADDAGMDFGCYGNDAISTPNIDKLAEGGLKCTNAFLTSPQCSPSRTSMLSGQFAHTIGTEDLHTGLDDSTIILPTYLKKTGYFTGYMLKGHLGENGHKQFDWFDNGRWSSGDWNENVINNFNNFINEADDKPFFMWVGFTDPHRVYAEDEKEGNRAPKVNDPTKVKVPPYLVDSDITRRDLANYYDEITRMDNHIGDMIEVLRERKILDNTIVIFLSDNGMPFPRAKGTLYDSGIQTPLIFYWERKIGSGLRYDGLLSTIDLSPTILDLAGQLKPAKFYGDSFQKIFYNQELEISEHVFAERNWHNADEHMRAIRTKNYLLILNSYIELPHGTPTDLSSSPSWFELINGRDANLLTSAQSWLFKSPRYAIELYDVQDDPFQINNISGKEEYLDISKELVQVLVNWMQSTKDHPPNERRKHDVVDRISGYPIANGAKREFYEEYWGD